MSEPAWHPDPTGRHHYRWWDGANWTDSVSTNGVVGTDPLTQPAVSQPMMTQPVMATTATPVDASAGAARPQKKNPLMWIIPVIVVVAVGVGLFVLLGGGDDDGGGGQFGAFEAELEDGSAVFSKNLELKRGDAVRIRVEPGERDLDTLAMIVTSDDLADDNANALEELFSDDGLTDLGDFFTDSADILSDADLAGDEDGVSLQTIDVGFEGEPDADFFVAAVDGTYTLVVGSVDPDIGGAIRVVIERFDTSLELDSFDGLSDIEEFFSDEDAFFSDEDFFSNSDEFEVGS